MKTDTYVSTKFDKDTMTISFPILREDESYAEFEKQSLINKMCLSFTCGSQRKASLDYERVSGANYLYKLTFVGDKDMEFIERVKEFMLKMVEGCRKIGADTIDKELQKAVDNEFAEFLMIRL